MLRGSAGLPVALGQYVASQRSEAIRLPLVRYTALA